MTLTKFKNKIRKKIIKDNENVTRERMCELPASSVQSTSKNQYL